MCASVPCLRHNPQFNETALLLSLTAVNVNHVHASGVGGFRPTTANSLNTGWRNMSSRSYYDYVQTMHFAVNLASVIELARTARVALMCAGALPTLIDRRRLAREWRRRQRDRQPEAPAVSQAYAVCPRLREKITYLFAER